MLKCLTHFRRRSNRHHNHQIPNHNLNPDNPQIQQEDDGQETNASDDDDEVNDTQLGGGDHDGDVIGEIKLQTASSKERMREIESVNEETETVTVTASSGEIVTGVNDSKQTSTALKCGPEEKRMEAPPLDDCCPICFGNFVVPCRGPCGHWYCGGCILQYWNYTAALQPCNCPMCSAKITKLTPEASLYQQKEAEVVEVLKNVCKYNRLFVGGVYGLVLKVFELPLFVSRMFSEMMNPDRPGAHLNKLRLFAMLLGCLYSICPFDFLRIGRHNVVDIFDYSAITISLVLYGFGIYIRRQRFRDVRELAANQL